ncbi:MAG: carboxypeptidase-like regulatory domain-containing protein, partial [Sphingobacteriaceae bacterium]|nr:carboxypeptidase-like regulatory domain-containing protein [Cytophagaceae bacterium]
MNRFSGPAKFLHLLLPLALLTALVTARAPQPARLISGTVTDSTGQALPGVSVWVKGTRINTYTDGAGFFKLQVSASARTLVFSVVGFQKKEISFGRDSVVNVRLQADASALDKVVVTGYSTEMKREVNGVVSRMRPGLAASPPFATAPMRAMNNGDEDYDHRAENGFLETSRQALTTFSIDVDRA